MSIYDEIKGRFVLPNAYEDWKTYRDALTDIVLDRCGNTVAIAGAGRCNDIDLVRLAGAAEHITLIDIDRNAMMEAASRVPKSLQHRIELKCATLSGIEDPDIGSFCNDLLLYVRTKGRSLNADSFAEVIVDRLDRIKEKQVHNADDLKEILPEDHYDTVVCNGVCSQLYSMLSYFIDSLIWNVSESLLPEVVNIRPKIHGKLTEMNDALIPVVVQAIIRSARGAAIFGNEYDHDNPVEGAHQCVSELRRNYAPEKKELIWDFNPKDEIRYRMMIQIMRQ